MCTELQRIEKRTVLAELTFWGSHGRYVGKPIALVQIYIERSTPVMVGTCVQRCALNNSRSGDVVRPGGFSNLILPTPCVILLLLSVRKRTSSRSAPKPSPTLLPLKYPDLNVALSLISCTRSCPTHARRPSTVVGGNMLSAPNRLPSPTEFGNVREPKSFRHTVSEQAREFQG